MLLTLPTFSPAIPTHYALNEASALQFRQALCLSRLGALPEAQLATLDGGNLSATDLDHLIAAGWSSLLDAYAGFERLSCSTRLTYGAKLEFPTSDAPQSHTLLYTVAASYPTWIGVGHVIEALDAHLPGAGIQVLEAIEHPLCLFGHPHSVTYFQSMAEYAWWYGEEDETVVLEECGEDCDVPRRSDLFAGLPEWAFVGQVAHETKASLTWDAIEAAFADTPFAPLIAAAGKLRTLEISLELDREQQVGLRSYYDDVEEAMPAEPAAVLYWKDERQFNQLIDDHMQTIYECGTNAPWALEWRFDPTPESIEDAMKRIAHTGHILKALDHALTLLHDLDLAYRHAD